MDREFRSSSAVLEKRLDYQDEEDSAGECKMPFGPTRTKRGEAGISSSFTLLDQNDGSERGKEERDEKEQQPEESGATEGSKQKNDFGKAEEDHIKEVSNVPRNNPILFTPGDRHKKKEEEGGRRRSRSET